MLTSRVSGKSLSLSYLEVLGTECGRREIKFGSSLCPHTCPHPGLNLPWVTHIPSTQNTPSLMPGAGLTLSGTQFVFCGYKRQVFQWKEQLTVVTLELFCNFHCLDSAHEWHCPEMGLGSKSHIVKHSSAKYIKSTQLLPNFDSFTF